MYYVLLGILAIVLFILRKRILGGLVGVISLVIVIGLTIFMLDFFWLGQDFTGEDRDVRNFEATQEVVEEYDDVVKDPVQKAKDIGTSVKDKGMKANDNIKDAGSALDEQLGIQKELGNNNLWGSDDTEEQETGNTEETVEPEETKQEGTTAEINSTKEQGDKSSGESTKAENTLAFKDLKNAETVWGLGKEDAKFVNSASPFNLGEFSNGSITIVVEDGGVTLK